jgi:diguanylate cyclase (GGDEF)-like protein
MLEPRGGLRAALAALTSRPDDLMLEMGATGELIVARLRVVVSALILLFPVANALEGGAIVETVAGLAAAVLLNVVAHVWLALARKPRKHDWLPFLTSGWDVTVGTAALAVLAVGAIPAGLNSLVVFSGYLVAIAVSALRSDGRVTLFTGALAIAQYAGLVAVALAMAESPERLVSTEDGTVSLAGQLQRLGLLAVFTLVTCAVVYRMQRLVELSGTDGLTGLPNRTWLHHRMPRLLDEVRANGSSLTMALIDMDRFRVLNEEAGFKTGDAVLRQLIDYVREEAMHDEWLVRIGGQEFVLLLRQPLGTAWEHVDAIRQAIYERGFIGADGETVRQTISAGLASFPHEASDLSDLLRRADHRLKRAKREGGNRAMARDA